MTQKIRNIKADESEGKRHINKGESKIDRLLTWYLYRLESVKDIFRDPVEWLNNQETKFLKKYTAKTLQQNKSEREQILKKTGFPLVSIILPVLNSEKTILRAIQSIQQQSYENWELIIVNDGSTDKTYNLITKLAKHDNRILIHCNAEKKGVSYSRNIGLFHAKGEFITFHDADDRSEIERIEYQLAELCSRTYLKVVTFLYCRETEQGEPLITNGKIKWNRVSGMMFRRAVFEQLGYFKPLHISEDSEYYERIRAFYGKKASNKIQKLLYYSLFDTSSLLFSNANVEIRGNRIRYQITEKEHNILKEIRESHQDLHSKNETCYQRFQPDL